MRLVNVETLRLEEYLEDDAPQYAILSHTWGEDSEELSFQDFSKGSNGLSDLKTPRNLGLAKLHGSCRQAKIDNIGHVWIDTCCIDRTNSVELSEAINSMFRWYSQAQVCYAYLADVPSGSIPQLSGSRFRSSRWYVRGWTLQELLALEQMKFYDAEWNLLGTKGALSASISNVTGIPRRYLLGLTSLRDASVAQRMSWAARRQTKRPEDVSYYLLSIFDVSMPMVYGEGRRHAFFRLQEQIIRRTRDDSILAWGLGSPAPMAVVAFEGLSAVSHGNVLANHPLDFVSCGDIVKGRQQSGLTYALEISGDGIRANLALEERSSGDVSAILCCYPENDARLAVSVPLVPTADNVSGVPPDEFIRPAGRHTTFATRPKSSLAPRSIYIRNEDSKKMPTHNGRQPYWFLVEGEDSAFDGIEAEPSSSWHADRSLLSMTVLEDGASILVRFCSREPERPDLVVKVVLALEESTLQPQCFAVRSSRGLSLTTIASSLKEIPHSRMQPHVTIGDSLHVASIISAGEATIPNLFILSLQMAQPLTTAIFRYLDMDEELRKCLARVAREDLLETGNQIQKPTERRFAKIPCPRLECNANIPHEWLCLTCDTYLEHGLTDDFFYCDCGRSHFHNFVFKCSSSAHGPDFQPYEPEILDQLPKSLDSSNYTNILILGEPRAGKSTLINAFVNYLAHPTFDAAAAAAAAAEGLDRVISTCFYNEGIQSCGMRSLSKTHKTVVGYNEVDEDWGLENELKDDLGTVGKGHLSTQKSLAYVLTIGNRVLRLIDTPGISDDEEEDDKMGIMTDVLRTVREYDSLHGILVVVNAVTDRPSSASACFLKRILSHLHQSATPNVVFGLTNVRRAQYQPQASPSYHYMKSLLDEFSTTDLALKDETTYCFDSESFGYLAALKQGLDNGNEEDSRRSWDHSRREMWRLLDHCASRQPHDAAKTITQWEMRQQYHLIVRFAWIVLSSRPLLYVPPEPGEELMSGPVTILLWRLTTWGGYEMAITGTDSISRDTEAAKLYNACRKLYFLARRDAILPLNDDYAVDRLGKEVVLVQPEAGAGEPASNLEEQASLDLEPLDQTFIARIFKIIRSHDWGDPELREGSIAIFEGAAHGEYLHRVHNGSGYALPPAWVHPTKQGNGNGEMQE